MDTEIPRIVKKINICELSDDGNPGTYNAFRYGGFICGISVLIAELLKGFIPVFFSYKVYWQRVSFVCIC